MTIVAGQGPGVQGIQTLQESLEPKFLFFDFCYSLMFTLSSTRITKSSMPKLQAAATDEFGVKQLNVLYNRSADLCFCFLEAPNRKQLENIMRNLYRSQTLVDFIKTLSYCKDLVRLNFY